jgi:chorismate dehydratase
VTIRIGGVPYGVGAPLLAGLGSDPRAALIEAAPTDLIARLREGELDVALVSSIEAIRQPGYRVAADLGIACKHEIRSVRAFRRRGGPIRSIGVDASSATSVALLRILLARSRAAGLAGDARVETIAPTTNPGALPHDLVLLIGDAGLRADPLDREVWDLGREWRALTGLPFVFALWLLRARGVAASAPSTARTAPPTTTSTPTTCAASAASGPSRARSLWPRTAIRRSPPYRPPQRDEH